MTARVIDAILLSESFSDLSCLPTARAVSLRVLLALPRRCACDRSHDTSHTRSSSPSSIEPLRHSPAVSELRR